MIEIFLLLTFYLFVLPQHVHAYLDPGTGSYITQVVIGFLVGGIYIAKVYWQQMRQFVTKLLNQKKQHGDENKK